MDYKAGPWFRAPRRQLPGVQIDLAFARADHVITLCEMKRQTAPIGKAVIAEVERKACILQQEYPRHTIQRVLVCDGPVSREVERSGYFFRILPSVQLIVNTYDILPIIAFFGIIGRISIPSQITGPVLFQRKTKGSLALPGGIR